MLATEGVGAEGNTSWNTTEGTSGAMMASTAGTATAPAGGVVGTGTTAMGCGPNTGDSGRAADKTVEEGLSNHWFWVVNLPYLNHHYTISVTKYKRNRTVDVKKLLSARGNVSF